MVAKVIRLWYVVRESRGRDFSLDEIREFGRRYDWPKVSNIADYLIGHPGAELGDMDRLTLERALEIDQSKLDLGEPGEFFEISLEER